MTRLKKIKQILTQPKMDVTRLACSYMETDTLQVIASLRGEHSKRSIPIDSIPEPYRSDVINSYERAKKELNIKY